MRPLLFTLVVASGCHRAPEVKPPPPPPVAAKAPDKPAPPPAEPCPARAPPSKSLPLANLAEVSVLADLPAHARATSLCDGLLFEGDGALAAWSPSGLAKIVTTSNPAFLPGRVAEGTVLVVEAGDLVGRHRATAVEHFRVRVGDKAELLRAVTTDGVVLTQLQKPAAWIALELVSGKVLWRADAALTARIRGRVLAREGHFTFDEDKGVFTVDAKTGKETSANAGFSTISDDGALIARSSTGVTTLDVPSKTLPLNDVVAAAVRGRTLYAHVHVVEGWRSKHRVEAWDLDKAKLVWSTAWQATTQGCFASFAALDDALYVLDDACTVHALARDKGKELFRFGARRTTSLLVLPTQGADATLVLAEEAPFLGPGSGEKVRLFRRGDKPLPKEKARIEGVVEVDGKPRGGVDVAVGDRLLTTDLLGRFSVTLEARGFVLLRAGRVGASCSKPGTAFGGDAELALDGRKTEYRVTVKATTDPCE